MKPDGERYLSNVMGIDISCEHWHRYFFAEQFVKDKVVLDIASGEGYGSNQLAKTAKNVIGVDNNKKTVEHATKQYPRKNLGFRHGSCTDFGIQSSFDIITSFETIEHIDQGEQIKFLQEIKSHLLPNGLLIISTPNTQVYTGPGGTSNPFHKHELTKEDFIKLLKKHFRNITLYEQRFMVGSKIWPVATTQSPEKNYFVEKTKSGFQPSPEGLPGAMYLIAVCSDSITPSPSASWTLYKNQEPLYFINTDKKLMMFLRKVKNIYLPSLLRIFK